MRRLFLLGARAILILVTCLALSVGASADVKEDRKAVAKRIGAEIASHAFKKVYVADFLDSLGGADRQGLLDCVNYLDESCPAETKLCVGQSHRWAEDAD